MNQSLRERILGALLENPQAPISGEELAARFGVSRVSIWKHVRALRHAGYPIEGRPHVGYRIAGATDLPVAATVEPLLQTSRIGRPYTFRPRVDSTNAEARRLAAAGAPHGTTVVADEQTQGRGRRGRRWWSAPGAGIWMSVLLRPRLPTGRAGVLTLLAAVAVREAVAHRCGLELMIKWPNDLLAADGRKVCGILVELAADQEYLDHAIVGIGINVRTPAGGFPPDVAALAATLEEIAGQAVQRPPLVAALCHSLEGWYERGTAGDTDAVLAAWRAACPWLGQPVEVRQQDRRLIATAEDIEADGGLRVRDADGRRHVIYAGEVSLRRAGIR